MNSRHRNINSAMASTCDWLFEHRVYHDWMRDEEISKHHGFLWIKGKPGTGKSTIMKLALEKIKRDRPDCFMFSYFFNARAPGELENSALGLYRSVVHQFLVALPSIRKSFVDQFSSMIIQEEGVRGDVVSVAEWTSVELQEFLIEVSRQSASLRICLFVDSLDEGDQQDVRNMVGFLEDLTQHGTQSCSDNVIRVCFSSRHYPLITVKQGLSLVLEHEPSHVEDIRKYIDTKLVIDEHATKTTLGPQIEKRSGQIFLWVVLVVPILNAMHDRGASKSILLVHLETLPQGLHDLFKQVLFKSKSDIATTILLFQWLLFAFDPLSPQEIYSAITMDARSPLSHHEEPILRTIEKYLLNSSRGLIEIVNPSSTSGAVQFIHETVRDFLLSPDGLATLEASLEKNLKGNSHEALRRCCQQKIEEFAAVHSNLREAKTKTIEIKAYVVQRLSQYGISSYAVSHIFHHADHAQRHGVEQTKFLADLDVQTGTLFIEILRQCTIFDITDLHLQPDQMRDHKKFSLLSILVHKTNVQYDDLIECMIDQTTDVDLVDQEFGTVLQAACALGNTRIAKRLIEAGADINAHGGEYDNALIAAILRGDDEMVELVSGCTAPTSEQRLWWALHTVLAFADEWQQVSRRVELLLSRSGTASKVMSEFVREYAVSVYKEKDDKVLQQMLARAERGSSAGDLTLEPSLAESSISMPGSDFLIEALGQGQLEVAEALLEGSCALSGTFQYRDETDSDDSLLCKAARGGFVEVVRVLLRSGGETDKSREMAYQAALMKGHEGVATLLQAPLRLVIPPRKGLRNSFTRARRSFLSKSYHEN